MLFTISNSFPSVSNMSSGLKFTLCQLVIAALLSPNGAVRWLNVASRIRSVADYDRTISASGIVILRRRNGNSPEDLLNLTNDESIEPLDTSTTIEHTNVTRFTLKYKGIPIYDTSFTIESDSTTGQFTGQATGRLVDAHEINLPSVTATLTESDAFSIAFNEFGSSDVRRKTISLVVYCPESGVATLAYKLTFFGYRNGNPSRPTVFIDANTGSILRTWDALSRFKLKSEGGNEKTGKLGYGVDMPYLDVEKSGSSCIFRDEDVIVYDMRVKTENIEDEMKFSCKDGVHDGINGAYSPASDAFYLGKKITEMFKVWAKSKACRFSPIEMYVHYGNNANSAFFDGAGFYFGDGQPGNTFPLVVEDVAAHEIAHCFTEGHAELAYTGQAGGIDEAFSDLTGEAIKVFLSGTNNWQAGSSALHGDRAIRYLCQQSEDGESIVSAKDFSEDLDVHHLSGVFNKFFCNLAKRDGWDTKTVFQVVSHANRFYWHALSDFKDAGCGIMKAAYDLGHDIEDVEKELETVAVTPCPLQGYIRALYLRGEISDLSADSGERIIFKIRNDTPLSKSIYIATSGKDGDVDMYVSRTSKVSVNDWNWRSTTKGNKEKVEAKIKGDGDLLVLLVPKDSHFSGVSVRTRGI